MMPTPDPVSIHGITSSRILTSHARARQDCYYNLVVPHKSEGSTTLHGETISFADAHDIPLA
jgi:hypothetical protein